MIKFVEEQDVTPARLSVELEKAVIKHRTTDEDALYIDDDGFFAHWVCVHPEFGLVGLRTYILYRTQSTIQEILELTNKINCVNYSICCYHENERIKFDCMINFRDGLLVNNFIRSVRNFSATINEAIRQVDPDYKILKRLSEGVEDNESTKA